jgi:hypothetical protein
MRKERFLSSLTSGRHFRQMPSHQAKQAANGQSATATLNAKAIKPALVLAAALVASVRCDRLPIADSQNELLRVSESADRDKLFYRKGIFEAITLWRNRL